MYTYRTIMVGLVYIYEIFVYVLFIKMVNNPINYSDVIYNGRYSSKKWVKVLYSHIVQDFIQESSISRNFQLIHILVESILIPSFIVFFYHDYLIQVALCMSVQIILFVLSIIERPYKYQINNIFLISNQMLWSIIFMLIIILGECIKHLI